MRTYRLRIEILSPVHVGTGEVYEPTDFFVHEKERYLGVIDFDKLCEYLSASEIKTFMELCREGSLSALLRLYDFIDQKCLDLLHQGIDGFVIRQVALCAGFIDHYQKVKQLSGRRIQQEFNRFTIHRTAFSSNESMPILPGSAIKGAIRTAVLNKRCTNARGSSWRDYCQGARCDGKQLESEILGYPKFDFEKDPFRLVKISDFFPVGQVKTKIVYAVNYRKQGALGRGPYQMFEIIEPGATFEGEMTLLESERRSGIRFPISFEEILEALRTFYEKEKDREFDELGEIEVRFPTVPREGFPLRLGRHSGAECVTIEGFRHIKIMQGRGQRPRFLDHATTVWLASEYPRPRTNSALEPFGWAVFMVGALTYSDKNSEDEGESLRISPKKAK